MELKELKQDINRPFGRLALALLLLLLGASLATADGTETLGAPSIAIAEGSDIIAAGTGLVSQPGTISIDVPAGATVEQVLLYWEGQMVGNNPGDDTIAIDGNAVTGTLIGGPTNFFFDIYSSAYRADITGLGLVSPGSNTLTVAGMNFSNANDGAGVLVIYDDGSGTSAIDIRDGLDLAFINFVEPLKSTVAQTFTFASSPAGRTVNLAMFFSSVSGTISGADADRPTSVEVTVEGVTTTYSNLLGSQDGEEWDTLNLPIEIPAGATTLTVEAFSRDDNGTGRLPASFGWVGVGLSVPPPPPPPTFTLGDRVWYDQNQNGIQDPNEPSYPDGVDVALYAGATCAGAAMATTSSDGSGFYQFTDLSAGTYSVGFSGLPAGWSISPAEQGGDDALNSDANGAGCIENINLTADDPDEDLGIYVPGTLGDDVRCLTTGDPLANITVSLFADFDGNGVADGPAIATTESDANGFYQFTGLEVALAGDPNNTTSYIVEVDVNDADLGTCNVPVPPTTYNPPLDSDNPDDPNNDFLFEEPPMEAPGTGTPGYWMNHPDAWPVDEITIGGVTYSKAEAIGFMKDPVKKDKTFTMFPALVAARLNVMVGNEDSCIADTIAAADAWLATYPLGSGVKGNSDAWKAGEPLYWLLDDYNNGLLCAPSRDSLE